MASFDLSNNFKGSLAYMQGSIIDQRLQSLIGSLANQQVPVQEFMHEVNMPEYDSRDEGVPFIEEETEYVQQEDDHESLETVENEPIQTNQPDLNQ